MSTSKIGEFCIKLLQGEHGIRAKFVGETVAFSDHGIGRELSTL
jgi:hypothetical protein